MANNNARQTNVSPGIYTKETHIAYAAKTLGETALGLVGETLKGPAFQPIKATDYAEYVDYFGGTNPSVFKGSGYLKYELPYIAKKFLTQSNNLTVVRVLGLSGYNAGPAWLITSYATGLKRGKNMVIGILRSRGDYQKTAFISAKSEEQCEDIYETDKLVHYVTNKDAVNLVPSKSFSLGTGCDKAFDITTDPSGDDYFNISQINFGRFTIQGTTDKGRSFSYPVSLNPQDKNYIIDVLGTKQDEGETEIYVEELYDVALRQLIEKGEIEGINKELVRFANTKIIPKYKACDAILYEEEITLTRKDIGMRFLATDDSKNAESGAMLKVHSTTDGGKTYVSEDAVIGNIYEVVGYVLSDGSKEFYYNRTGEAIANGSTDEKGVYSEAVKVLSNGLYYIKNGLNINPVTLELNNYKEQFRYASTPWIISDLKGDAENVEINKLFRFHTISDGNAANTQIKTSIENILPDEGLFDVSVRNFLDTDSAPDILEKYTKCNLVEGSPNYLGLRIGTSDERYATKSKYITVEINQNEKTSRSIPAGFLGYPVRDFSGLIPDSGEEINVQKPYFQYNTNYDENIKNKFQYFGVSDLTGIDEDIVNYKGVEAYNGRPQGLTPSFHLDSRIITSHGVVKNDESFIQSVSVDGVEGYEWVTVGRNNVTEEGIEPRIGYEALMQGTIYEDITLRKFTVIPFGGFDGWDVYRKARTNTDNFKANKYKGIIDKKSGEGFNFSTVVDPEAIGFDSSTRVITTDYYAYLAGTRQFSNPSITDINVFATPGIDYVNNTQLSQEVITMIEEERADSLYVMITPDKRFGASDAQTDMFTAKDVAYNLIDSNINTSYGCTHYPTLKYYDTDNQTYIFISPTKDFVSNLALTDNIAFPWLATAGAKRGKTESVQPKKILNVKDTNTLYGNRINYIYTTSKEGNMLWGNKTLYTEDTPVNRINVRRLILKVRKLIVIASLKLIWEQDDFSMIEDFNGLMLPILEDVRKNRGIKEFKITVEDSIEARDAHELNGMIFIKPIGSLEFINIGFVVTPEGTSFEEV
ncbi:hypothetical protein EZS27_007741 [termite gut metagenome]|uniref:Tail sheath protein C-terminal domain-containing protein n=1 Tax=termite gut metagenome TaxID=433724 RepID=A0A5J4SH86_9ZZZZ